MESLLEGKADGSEVILQCVSKAHGTAIPDTGLAPSRYGFSNVLAVEEAVNGIDQNLNIHAGGVGVGGELGERLVIALGGRVEEMNFLRHSRSGGGKQFHTGDKRRYADTSTNPDLFRTIIVEGEAAIRPFDSDGLAYH